MQMNNDLIPKMKQSEQNQSMMEDLQSAITLSTTNIENRKAKKEYLKSSTSSFNALNSFIT